MANEGHCCLMFNIIMQVNHLHRVHPSESMNKDVTSVKPTAQRDREEDSLLEGGCFETQLNMEATLRCRTKPFGCGFRQLSSRQVENSVRMPCL